MSVTALDPALRLPLPAATREYLGNRALKDHIAGPDNPDVTLSLYTAKQSFQIIGKIEASKMRLNRRSDEVLVGHAQFLAQGSPQC